MPFVGLDLWDRFSQLTVPDVVGDMLEETRLPTMQVGYQRKFSVLPTSRVAVEVGTHSRWASYLTEDLGHEVLVADAETLACLARLDPKPLAPVQHRSPEAQVDLSVIRSRDPLVRSRALLINHARSTVKASGTWLPSCSADSFHHKVQATVPEALQSALFPILDSIASFIERVKAFDRLIEDLCEESYLQTRLLRLIAGVGPLTALAHVLTLEDPGRFPKNREVELALGAVAWRDQSGDQDLGLRITKAGNVYLRQLLARAANYLLGPFGPECDLRRWE
jgi:transposase